MGIQTIAARSLRKWQLIKLLEFYKASSLTFKLGFWITVLSLIFALTIGWWTSLKGLIDFPCEYYGPPPERLLIIQPSTRLAYCLSWYPRSAGGGGIYADGISDENSITLHAPVRGVQAITVERWQENLFVKDKTLRPGETFEQSFWFPSLNPWLLLTAHLIIKNEGILKDYKQVIYVSGEVAEGWSYNPTGLVLILIGTWLMARGLKRCAV